MCGGIIQTPLGRIKLAEWAVWRQLGLGCCGASAQLVSPFIYLFSFFRLFISIRQFVLLLLLLLRLLLFVV